jgi:hypothetical protein
MKEVMVVANFGVWYNEFLITNFTFDSIFHFLSQTSENAVNNQEKYGCNQIVKKYEEAYREINGLLYLPGQIPIRSFDNEVIIKETRDWNKLSRFIIKLPLVHRPLQSSSKEIREKLLGLDESTPLLLICFGSWTPSAEQV